MNNFFTPIAALSILLLSAKLFAGEINDFRGIRWGESFTKITGIEGAPDSEYEEIDGGIIGASIYYHNPKPLLGIPVFSLSYEFEPGCLLRKDLAQTCKFSKGTYTIDHSSERVAMDAFEKVEKALTGKYGAPTSHGSGTNETWVEEVFREVGSVTVRHIITKPGDYVDSWGQTIEYVGPNHQSKKREINEL